MAEMVLRHDRGFKRSRILALVSPQMKKDPSGFAEVANRQITE